MQNYPIYNNYIQNCPFSMASSFLYTPIIYFDPNQVLFSQNFPDFHLNIIQPHAQTLSPNAHFPPAAKNVVIST